MDWITILTTQQIDFCQRIKSDCLLYSSKENQYTERIIIKGDTLNILIKSCQEVADKYKLIYPVEQVFDHNFTESLGKTAFQICFNDVVSPIVSEDTLDHGKFSFILKDSADIHFQIKTIYGNIDNVKWIFSPKEIEQNTILVCFLSQEQFDSNKLEYNLILAGFLPTHLIKKNYEPLNLNISDLFYAGGLRGYLKSFIDDQNDYLKIATQSVHKGDYIKAIANYSHALKTNLQDPKIYLLRGISRWKIGDRQGAIIDFTEAIRVNPDYNLAYHWRGYIYTELTDYQSAFADYTEEIRINPIYAYSYYRRGFTRSKINDHVGAIDDYSTAITINNKLYQAFYNRGISRYKLGDKQGAIDDYSYSLKLNPNLAQAYYSRGIIYADLGDYKKAIADYQEAIKISPYYPKAYYNLAIIQADLGDYKSAINTYNKVIEIKPDFIPAQYNRRALITSLEKEALTKQKNQEYSRQKSKQTDGSPYKIEISDITEC